MASNKSIAALRRREWSHLCATTVIAAQPKSGRLQRTGVSHFRAGGLRARDVRFGSEADSRLRVESGPFPMLRKPTLNRLDVSWSTVQIARMASGSRLVACATLRATR